MLRLPKNLTSTIYAVVLLILTAIGWQIFTYLDQSYGATQKQLKEAQEKISQLEILNQKLETANLLLKRTRRLAVISDIVKTKPEGSDVVKTSFSFTEIDMADNPLGEKRMFTIDGEKLYIDAYIIKFEDDYIEQGDPLKGTALCMFDKLFSEKIKPEDGFRIDPVGETPKPYKLDSPDSSEFEKELWGNFWKLAQDPKYAQKMGVRAAHGTAPSMLLQEGLTYKLEMRNTGELTFLQ
ncbi:MAG: hypothetical protein IJQ39_05085 [Thermoguttaceae bacterium]|nr:hypothetical protein [Thermoguttaceae bacterium]